ncbi:MAG: single-stranded DNA-binding protein [Bryobacterales bacterium]|nr:single-stranded DNA-binding protein [Bryobacterales bacterium]
MQKNNIELAGYLGGKPVTRFLPSGTKVANVRLAEGYRYVDAQKKEQEHTNWHAIVCYGRLADMIEQLNKGDNVLVNGTLQIREFTPADGSKRRVYEVIARTVAKIDRISDGDADVKDNGPHDEHATVTTDGGSRAAEDGWPL